MATLIGQIVERQGKRKLRKMKCEKESCVIGLKFENVAINYIGAQLRRYHIRSNEVQRAVKEKEG